VSRWAASSGVDQRRERRVRTGPRVISAIPWAILAVALGATGLVVAEVVWPTTGQSPAPRAPPALAATRSPAPPGPRSTPAPGTGGRAPRWDAFARVRGISLFLPARHPVAVAYHEAALDPALELHPLGHVIHNYNRFKFHSSGATAGPGYIVMSSRGRSSPATSAVDVVVRPDTAFRAPVSGRVVGLKSYELYCRYPDVRVAIAPDSGPHLRVVAIHLAGVRVRRGDRVFATLSVIGRPRVFRFRSQVDDYLHGGNPHVHIEVEKPSPTPVPTCPARHRSRARR
jgi:hypothetical protein